jgi:hypothetical protein
MDGTTAHVKMDSLLTKMGIHAMISMSAPLMVQHSVNLLAVTVITHLVAITAHVRKAIISMSQASYALKEMFVQS